MSDNTLDQSNNSVSLQTLAKSGIASEFDTELFDLLTQPACIVNSQGKISLINEEFYKLTMYGKDICSNYSICDILDFPDNVEKRAFLIRLLGKEIPGKVLTYKNLITSNGNRIGVRFSSKYMEKFNCFLLQFEDLSVRQNFTKALLSAKERADNSEKLKTEFLAQMSHEIRTPINAVLSFASLIEDEVQDKISDDLKSGFEIIKRGGDRIIRTVDLILDMSEVMAGTYDFSEKVTDIYYNIFLDIEETYRMFASEKHLEFIVSKETSNTMLELDEYSVRQIFSNILDNAVKFTHSGTIKIRFYQNETGNLVFEVSDTGIGISKDYLPRIFEPFTQENQGYTRLYEGNGLGLSLSKKFCEKNNLDLEISTQKGNGSTFKIIFSKEFHTPMSRCVQK